MTNLTPSESRRLIDKLHHNQTKEHGISILEEKYLAALEIALTVLEQQGGWISCSERMPEEREQVILWDADLDEHTSGHYSDQTGKFYSGGMIIDNEITHWMPAPASPQPKTDTYRQIENDGWIEWGGGRRPVDEEAFVEVKFKDGEYRLALEAWEFDWNHYGNNSDIIAYRVIENDGREG